MGGSVFQDHAIAWKKLWPELVAERDFEGFDDEPVSVLEDSLSLDNSIGLEVDDDDVEELMAEYHTKLTPKELREKIFREKSNRQQLKSSLQRRSSVDKVFLLH